MLTVISGLLVVLTAFLPHNGLYGFVSKYFWSRGLLAIAGARLKITGRENLDPKGNYIYISNHESDYDIPAIYASIPVNLYFIAKKELKKIPFLGWAMQAVGMIFIDRSNREKAVRSMKEAGEIIRRGKNVLSFPEGTRSRTGKIARFKKGTFILARENNLNIVPLAVDGTHEILPSNKFVLQPGTVRVIIGKPIITAEYAHLSPDEFAAAAKDVIENLLTENSLSPQAGIDKQAMAD